MSFLRCWVAGPRFVSCHRVEVGTILEMHFHGVPTRPIQLGLQSWVIAWMSCVWETAACMDWAFLKVRAIPWRKISGTCREHWWVCKIGHGIALQKGLNDSIGVLGEFEGIEWNNSALLRNFGQREFDALSIVEGVEGLRGLSLVKMFHYEGMIEVLFDFEYLLAEYQWRWLNKFSRKVTYLVNLTMARAKKTYNLCVLPR